MGVTLNKDGTPRKVGSGKTKGAGCFAKIKWQHLREFINEEENILVSRVWLRSVGALNQKKGSRKKLPLVNSQANAPKPSPVPLPTKPKILPSLLNNSSMGTSKPERSDEDEYDPPPLFASIGEIKKY
jgi:hypothetical protein